MKDKESWLKFYGDVPESIDYPEITLYEAVMRTCRENPDAIAYDFLGHVSTYGRFAKEIDQFAGVLAHLGLKKGDRITIAMPTAPQGIICFYAVNKLGGVASMIHPLSTEPEIEFYVSLSKSRFALTIDAFYQKFRNVMDKTCLDSLILTKIPDYLPLLKRIGFNLTKGRKIPKVSKDSKVLWWKDLMQLSLPDVPAADMNTHDLPLFCTVEGLPANPRESCSPTTTLSRKDCRAPVGPHQSRGTPFWQSFRYFTDTAWAFASMLHSCAAGKPSWSRPLHLK